MEGQNPTKIAGNYFSDPREDWRERERGGEREREREREGERERSFRAFPYMIMNHIYLKEKQ